MFWGPVQLQRKLSRNKKIEPFDANRIDGASYRLSIGDEVYVSPIADSNDVNIRSITRLKKGEAFAIPPGQFAFLLTKEVVEIGSKEIAFISIRAKTKYRGLVNVSGFHVDPTFNGRLTFAVYNAGPTAVHLRQGQELFLIWYADLSDPCEKQRNPGPHQITSEMVSGISGNLYSIANLGNRMTDVEQRLEKKLNAVTRELAIFRIVAAIAVTLLITTFGIVMSKLPALAS